jgi:hypothetical protein
MAMRVLFAAFLLLGIGSLSAKATCPGGETTFFRVTGGVVKPTVFTLKRLQQYLPAQENVTYIAMGSSVGPEAFTGVLLWDLLTLPPVGGIVVNPSIKNDILHKVVVVTGSDCYQSVFGAGEISPMFGGNQIMVAYASNGTSFPDDALARIVAPGDKAGGRFVSNIASIVVKDAGK